MTRILRTLFKGGSYAPALGGDLFAVRAGGGISRKVLAVALGLWLLQPIGAIAGRIIRYMVIPPNPMSGDTFDLPNYGLVLPLPGRHLS